MLRASDLWIQLKGEPAINPMYIQVVDIIVEVSTNDFSFNVIFTGGDHLEIKSTTLAAAKRKRQSILLQAVRKI